MKVLITGAGGFIGKNLCQALQERLPQVQLLWTESYTPKAILAQYAAQWLRGTPGRGEPAQG